MRTKYLYYWNNEHNIGDYASLYIIKKISQDKIIYKNPFIHLVNIFYNILKFIVGKKSNTIEYVKHYVFPWQKTIFGVGSILDFATKNCIIWGSGFREPHSKSKCKNIVAVRGYKTLELIDLPYKKSIKIGDPALLLPIIFSPNSINKKGIAIIPHYKEFSQISSFNQHNYPIIDIRTNDIENFITQLCQYEYIISSSLHGIIIAHAYNIKAIWIQNGDIGSSSFKFYDYFSSINVTNYPQLKAREILDLKSDEIISIFHKYQDQVLPQLDVKKIQRDLLKCAPFHIQSIFIL